MRGGYTMVAIAVWWQDWTRLAWPVVIEAWRETECSGTSGRFGDRQTPTLADL
jgi:hypothetical protein